MSTVVELVGNIGESISPATNTVVLTAAEIENLSATYTTGTLRLELWLTTAPWNPTASSNPGYEIATDRITGNSNGTLGPDQYFSAVSAIVPYVNHPPAGTYFATLAVAEYSSTANQFIDNGYVIDTTSTFSNYVVVGTNGSVTTGSSISQPFYSVTNDGQSTITEGGTERFTVSTLGVAAGTVLDYSLLGVSTSEVVGEQLTGTVIVGSNGQATLSVALTDGAGQGLASLLAVTISATPGGTSLASATEPMTETRLADPTGGGTSLAVGSVIASPGQSVSLSSLFKQAPGANNPTYIDVTMLDRNEYPDGSTRPLGYLSGNGQNVTNYNKLEVGYFGAAQTDAYDTGIIFTYQGTTGRYYNSTYGYFDQLSFTASTAQYQNAYITIFGSNSRAGLSAIEATPTDYFLDPETLASLAANAGAGALGTVDVITRTDIPGPAPVQATPFSLAAAATTFVGKVWNDEGCWVLASNIAAQAGSSLPSTTPGGASIVLSGGSPSTPVANGEWIVAYYGRAHANATISLAEAVVCPGDVITTAWTGGGGHITTVVSGFGAQAQVIDNEVTGTNSANDGYAADIVILAPHSLDSELEGNESGSAVATSIVIYRLDTPTITVATTTNTVLAGKSVALSPLFSATDADGVGTRTIAEYKLYDVGTGAAAADTFSIGGQTESAHTAATAILVTAAQLAGLELQTVGGAAGADTVYVSAYNGAYWGDATSLNFAVTDTTISGPLTAAQAITDYNSSLLTSSIAIDDTAKNVDANLDGLESLALVGKVTAITLTDDGIPTLSISAAQIVSDSAALQTLTGYFSLNIEATGQNLTIAGPAIALGNTVVINGDANQYTITPSGDGNNFAISSTSGSGKMSNIQSLQFNDFTEIVAPTPGSNGVVTGGNITELYGAVFGRVPDVPGLTYYEKQLAANPGLSLSILAGDFLSSPEYIGNAAHNYAQTPDGDAQFITDLYSNLLHRAPESGAIPYYQKLIGQFTQGLAAGTSSYTGAELTAHATVLVDFSASTEFLGDVQVGAAQPASAGFTGHWLVLI